MAHIEHLTSGENHQTPLVLYADLRLNTMTDTLNLKETFDNWQMHHSKLILTKRSDSTEMLA